MYVAYNVMPVQLSKFTLYGLSPIMSHHFETNKQINFDFDSVQQEESPVTVVGPATIHVPAPVIEERLMMTEKKSTRGRMKLSDMKTSAEQVQIPEDSVLFEKSYYSIGAVADMFRVNQSLIRFWENEFDIIKPKKNAKGDRLFRPEDIKNLQLIYHLLREKKFTIEGAKEFLKKNKKADERFASTQSLKKLREFLLELKANL